MDFTREEELPKVLDAALLKWVWGFVRPYQRMLWLSFILMPLDAAFSLAQPYVVKLTIDLFLTGKHTTPPRWLAPLLAAFGSHGLLAMGALYVVLVVGEFTTFYGQFYLTMMVAQYSLSDLRVALFRHVETLPMAYFDRTPVGRLVSRMTTDIDAISEMFSAGALTIVIDVLTLCGIVVIMFSFNPRLALWALGAIPLLVVMLNFFRLRARVLYRQTRERLAALNAYLSESLSGMQVIQLFTREKVSFDEFDDLNRQSRDVQIMANVYESALFSAVEALKWTTIAIIVWVGGGQVIRGLISLGTLVAFSEYAQKFFMPLSDISNKYTTIQSALASAEKIEAVMRLKPAITTPAVPRRPALREGTIIFDNVSFAYRPDEPVLRNVSFTVSPGQKVAIVGATGSGKTTIIKLLSRFYDVTSGRILVDGVDVREWDLTALRREIGLVQQDVFLFAGNVEENIRLSRSDLGEGELRGALARAQALGFVDRLPSGLREQVRERGSNFSAGQRQLLSFARTLAYDPRILVMDEATSSVDSETEHLVQRALDELLSGRTAVIIAHRLSTIEKADRILVMSSGVVRESGTHEELLKQRGLYRRLFELQYASATEQVPAAR